MIEGWIERMRAAATGDLALDAWSVYGTESRRLSLGIKDGQAGNAHAPLAIAEGSMARYLFVWGDGTISRGVLQRSQLADEARAVLTEARRSAYQDPDAAHVSGTGSFEEVPIHDDEVASIATGSTGRLAERLQRLRERIDASAIGTWSGSLSAGMGKARVVTSAGLDVAGEGTSWGWFASGDGLLGEGFGGRRVDDATGFERRVERMIETVALLKGEIAAVPAGKQRVLLHPDVADRYAISTLLHHLDGSTVANEEGRFAASQFGDGEAHLPERFSLRLDPLTPWGVGSYRFTSEGVPAARCSFVERGRLVQPYCTLKYARRLDREPTPLPYESDSLEIDSGPRRDRRTALGGERTLLVLSVLGVHTQDRTSGDFSLSAPQVLVFENGRCLGRQKGTISGNLFDVLAQPDFELVDFPDEQVPGMAFACNFEPA